MSTSAPAPGAATSYAGYEYQFLATVWIALKLILEESRCSEIQIEPASGEDVGANVNPAPPSADETSTTVRVSASGTVLNIQIKRRANNWTHSSFRDVLLGDDQPRGKRGPKPRARAVTQLRADPNARYVFLTNAQLSADLETYRVASIGDVSAATTLPIEPQTADAAALAPRIAIIPDKPEALLTLEIEQMLRRNGDVPETKIDACRKELISAVRLRVLGEATSAWTRLELEKVLVAHSGRLDPNRAFIAPTILALAEERLQKAHKLLLTGVAGVGKTDLAYELARRHQTAPEKFEIVGGDVGIEGIRRRLRESGPCLFFIEDPWGHDRLNAEANMWVSELPKLLRDAKPTKRFLVTSRVGVCREAIPLGVKELINAEVELKPEHYPEDVRREIVAVRLASASPWQRDWTSRHERKWLRELDVPLALDHFASRVVQAAAETDLRIDDLVHESKVDSLAPTFVAEIRARGTDSVAAALVLWAIHQTAQHVTTDLARTTRMIVTTGGYHGRIDPEQVLNIFVNGGWFRPAKVGYAAHPTALSGIESLLTIEPGLADDVLGALLTGLVNSGEVERAFSIVQHLELRPTVVSNAVRFQIENLLFTAFMTGEGYDAKRALQNLADHAISDRPEILLLRLVSPTRRTGVMSALRLWSPPSVQPEEIARIRASAESQSAALNFISKVLFDDPLEHGNATEIVEFFRQFGWNFGAEFAAELESRLHNYGPNSHVDFLMDATIASGFKELPALLEALLVAEDRASEIYEKDAADYRKAEQAEIDASHASHLAEDPGELFSPLRTARNALVAARRRVDGWKWITTHPERSNLVWAWAEAIDAAATSEELQALSETCTDSRQPYWEALAHTANPAHLPELLAEGTAVPVDDIRVWIEAVEKLAPEATWQTMVAAALAKLPSSRRLALAMLNRDDEAHEAPRRWFASELSDTEKVVMNIMDSVERTQTWPEGATADTRAILRELVEHGSVRQRRTALLLLGHLGEDISIAAAALLGSTMFEERMTGLYGLSFFVRESESAVIAATRDADYRVRREALRLLAGSSNPDLPKLIAPLACDPSAPVREAWVAAVVESNDATSVPTLIRLLQDTRDARPSTLVRASWPDYHVARAAARALSKFKLDGVAIDACVKFVSQRDLDPSNDDIEVHYHVLTALAAVDGDKVVPLFIRFLKSDWHVDGHRGPGYPLRFAAAWGLVEQLRQFPARRSQIDLDLLAEAAQHDDYRLAAPALVALASIGHDAIAHLVEIAKAPATTPARAIIARAALPQNAESAARALEAKLPDHPVLTLLRIAPADLPAPDNWPRWLARHPSFHSWLKSIARTEHETPWIRYALGLRFTNEVPPELKSDDKFDHALPEPIQTISIRSMFGGE